MNIIDNIRKEFDRTLKVATNQSEKQQFGAVNFGVTAMPRIVEKKNADYVSYGEDNLYPQQIEELSKQSAIHGAIIKTAGDMIAGDGFLIDGAVTIEESQAKLLAKPEQAT